MNRTLTLMVSALLLGGAPLALAQFTSPTPITTSTTGPVVFDSSNVYVNPGLGRYSGFLNISNNWQLIQVPVEGVNLASLNGVSLNVSGLPEGLNVSVARATQAGNFLLLYVNVSRSNGNAVPRGLADVTVLSGSTTLARFQVSVQYVPALEE